MSKILTEREFEENIRKYYLDNYGERDTDVWCEVSAINVRVFLRDGKYIILKSHILTGEIEERVEQKIQGDV